MPYLLQPGANLFYDVHGDGPETIITTHGLTHSGAYWSRTGISQALSEAGFRVVDLDLRGHGRSTPLPDEDPGYTVDRIARDLGALGDHLGRRSVSPAQPRNGWDGRPPLCHGAS